MALKNSEGARLGALGLSNPLVRGGLFTYHLDGAQELAIAGYLNKVNTC